MSLFILTAPEAYFTHFPYWGTPIKFRRAYNTNILISIVGKEQRSSLITIPILSTAFMVKPPSKEEANYLGRYLRKYLHNVWGVPLWFREMNLSSIANSGQNVLNITETRYRGISAGTRVIVIHDYKTYDAGVVYSYTNTSLTLTSNLTHSYNAGKKVYPLISAELQSPQSFAPIVPGYTKIDFEFMGSMRSTE